MRPAAVPVNGRDSPDRPQREWASSDGHTTDALGAEVAMTAADTTVGSRARVASAAQLPGRTVVITGKQDSAVGWRDQLDLTAFYQHQNFAALDGAGHNVHLDQPEPVGHLIATWLDSLPGAARDRPLDGTIQNRWARSSVQLLDPRKLSMA